ncbi:unnamed protein product, partial [marine sediment metagenome]
SKKSHEKVVGDEPKNKSNGNKVFDNSFNYVVFLFHWCHYGANIYGLR